MKKILIITGLLLISGLGIVYGTDIFFHNNVVQDVEVIQKRVQFDPRYFAGVEGYYSVGQQIQVEKQQQAINQQNLEISELKTLIKALCERLGHADSVKPADPVVPVTPPVDVLQQNVELLLKTRCANCHSNGANGFDIFDDSGKLTATFEQAELIHHRTEGLGLEPGENLMPKGGKPLNNDEMILIKKWMHSKNPLKK